jgi:hypothetical protein
VAEVGDSFLPGEPVPEAGVYICDGPFRHEFRAERSGGVFSPMPVTCFGKRWVLAHKRHRSKDADSRRADQSRGR